MTAHSATHDTPDLDGRIIAAARSRAAELIAQGQLSAAAVARINATLRGAAERARPADSEKQPA